MSNAQEGDARPPRTRRDTAVAVLIAACALLAAVDLFIDRHPDFPLEEIPGFYPMIGGLAAGALLRGLPLACTFLRRPEDYYDR